MEMVLSASPIVNWPSTARAFEESIQDLYSIDTNLRV